MLELAARPRPQISMVMVPAAGASNQQPVVSSLPDPHLHAQKVQQWFKMEQVP